MLEVTHDVTTSSKFNTDQAQEPFWSLEISNPSNTAIATTIKTH